MSANNTKRLMYRFFEAVEHYLWGKENALDTFLSPQFVDHILGSGREGMFTSLQVFRNSFSDVHLEVRDLVVEGETVVANLTLDAFHTEMFLNMPPTYRRTRFGYVVAYRVTNNMVVERLWELSDSFTMWKQLGFSIFFYADAMIHV